MLYNRFFDNIVTFFDDIQIMPFNKAIMIDDRFLIFGILLIILSILLIPIMQ
jgi:hypothetical protein